MSSVKVKYFKLSRLGINSREIELSHYFDTLNELNPLAHVNCTLKRYLEEEMVTDCIGSFINQENEGRTCCPWNM